MKMILPLAGIAAAVTLCGCTVGPDYRSPQMNVPSRFEGQPPRPSAEYSTTLPLTTQTAQITTKPASLHLARWWEALNDPELNSLVQRAIRANPDLQIAVNRLQAARSIEAVFTGQSLPDAEFSAGAGNGSGTNSTKGRVSQPLNAGTNTTGLKEITQVLGFDAAWELDLFGHLRRQAEADQADTRAASDYRDQVLVTLIGDVARSYMDVRTLQARIDINQQAIKVQQDTAEYAEGRYQRGFVGELDAALADRELRTTESTLAPLQAELATAKQSVAVLLGEFPEDLGTELDQTAPLPQPPAELPTGLPSDLLRRRPDVRLAENQLIAANAQIGVATSALYPQIFLTAGAGWQGQGLGRTPVRWDDIWSVGPAVRWALFDFGTIDAAINVENFHTREMLWEYRKSVINAVQEVDSALQSYDAQRTRLSDLAGAQTAAERSLTLANGRYERGIIDFLNVLDAQRQLFILKDQYALSEDQTVTQFIAVCKALGGGWEGFAPPPAPRGPRPAIVAAVADALTPSRSPTDGTSSP
jgi:NodT family efflux transporter outer membrane factor (OMF) lipoprotein